MASQIYTITNIISNFLHENHQIVKRFFKFINEYFSILFWRKFSRYRLYLAAKIWRKMGCKWINVFVSTLAWRFFNFLFKISAISGRWQKNAVFSRIPGRKPENRVRYLIIRYNNICLSKLKVPQVWPVFFHFKQALIKVCGLLAGVIFLRQDDFF